MPNYPNYPNYNYPNSQRAPQQQTQRVVTTTSQTVKRKNHSWWKALLIILIGLILLAAFVIAAIILAPKDPVPDFEIHDDENGIWVENGSIGVFDPTIMPGSHGKFYFTVTNTSGDSRLDYGFMLQDRFYTDEAANAEPITIEPFMQYRVKMDGVYLGGSAWRYAYQMTFNDLLISQDSSHLFMLEWQWPMEGGNDKNDTLVGRTGGKLLVHFSAWASVHPE